MTEQKCKWTTEPPKHVPHPHPKRHDCPESTLNGCDHCILHSDKTKDLNGFLKKVKKRIHTKANVIDLRGLYFPKDFNNEYFKEKKFTKPVFFNETTFCGKVNFSGAKFLKGADFYGTKFSAETSFEKTVFKGFKTNFRKAKFEGDIFFFDTQFRSEEVSFNKTEFSRSVKFDNPYFYGRAYFIETKFNERCEFGWGEFPATQQPIFKETDLRNCSFLHSNIDKVDFRYCEFAEVKGRKNVLRDELDADEAVGAGLKPAPTVDEPDGDEDEDVEKNLSETGTGFFASLRMTRKEKKLRRENYEPVRRLYQELKCNFEDKKDWNTAGDFHYGEMECRRKKMGWWGRNIFSLEALYYGTSGYGERPWRAFFGVMVLILGFALFYLPPASNVSQLPSNTPTLPSPIKGEGKHVEISPKPTNSTLPDEGKGVESREEASGKFLSMYIGKRYLDGFKTSLRTTFFLGKEEKGWPNTIQSILGPILVALLALALRRKVKR